MNRPVRYQQVPLEMSDETNSSSKRLHVRDSSAGAAMRRVALLVDGMARAAILPFGPRLIHRLTFHTNWYGAAASLDTTTWSQVASPTAFLIATYTLGRALGGFISKHVPVSQAKLPQHVARLAGLAFALHLFTFGAGLQSVRWLVVIRFLSSILAGLLCGIADFSLPEDKPVESHIVQESTEELMEQGGLRPDVSVAGRLRKRLSYVDVTPATAKIYMTGFAVSIITGGLLYRHASTSAAFQALTGGNRYTLSPLFFMGVASLVEFVLRCVFAFSADRGMKSGANLDKLDNEGGAVQLIVKSVVNRRVRISNSVSARSPGHFARDEEVDQLEFYDPLSLSRHSLVRRGRVNSASATPNRSRVNSAISEASSEFFDCNSTFCDDLDADPLQAHASRSASSQDDGHQYDTEIALYRDGRCVYPNGAPAFVTQGDCIANVPKNYLDFYKGNNDKALKAWRETQAWRKDKHVSDIHRRPHPLFQRIKEAYPHIIHGHSKTGQVVVYEHPGKMNLKELFRSGCHVSDMLEHLTFFLEYVGNCVGTRDELQRLNGSDSDNFSFASWGTMVVMDIQGCSISSLTGDVMSYLSQSGTLQSEHYPNVLKRVFVVNCPFFVAGAWSMIKGIVPESVHVEILSSSNALDAMLKYIDEDQIPPEYGGSSPFALGEHPYERGCYDVAEKAGQFQGDMDMEAPPVVDEPRINSSSSFDHDHSHRQQINDSKIFSQREELGDSLFFPFAYDQREQKWVPDGSSAESDHEPFETIKHMTLGTETKKSSLNVHTPLRRRVSSVDRLESMPLSEELNAQDDGGKVESSSGGDGEILLITSVMYVFWCAIQGVIEMAVPLWLLSPSILGGLGYAPSRSGMALFCASMVLLWLMRTKVARVVSQLPHKAPMRAFRIATGSQAALMAFLTFVPSHVSSVPRTESVLVMASTIIGLSSTALASMLGQAGIGILHRIASENYSRTCSTVESSLCRWYGRDEFLVDCESGKFSVVLRLAGEILGIVAVAPLYSWSTWQERPAPLDASCAFFMVSLVALVLYVSSFSLYLNVIGEFAPHPSGCGGDVDMTAARRCCSFVGEVFSVSVGDMASLFEEANWSSSPLLGYSHPQQASARRTGGLDRSVHHRPSTKSV